MLPCIFNYHFLSLFTGSANSVIFMRLTGTLHLQVLHLLWDYCWTLGSALPTSFATWVNPFSWMLTPAIVAETNACGFCSNTNGRTTNGIRAQVRNSPGTRWREIVRHWVQRFPRVSRHGLIPSRGSLTPAIMAETNTCGFWSNGYRSPTITGQFYCLFTF